MNSERRWKEREEGGIERLREEGRWIVKENDLERD